VSATAGEFFARLDEVKQRINLHRKELRALAEARCPHDNRLLGAVYQFPDRCYLWTAGERMTPEQMYREVLEMAVLEYETAVEDGANRQEAWTAIVGAAADAPPRGAATWPPRVNPLGDPLDALRSLTFEKLATRLADGEFASCGSCRRTYVVDYAVMQYAAGLFLSQGRIRPVVVQPGRVAVAGTEPALEGSQEYGLIHSWQVGPWTVDGHLSQDAVA
jgi:hypothetical protein